jgi:hypothetical protein
MPSEELEQLWKRCEAEKGKPCDRCPKDGNYCAWALAQITKDALVKSLGSK